MNQRQLARRRGFTLVEVLTVVIIIGILMGMLFVAFGKALLMGKTARIKGESTELVNAMSNFTSQLSNGQYPPDFTNKADVQAFMQMVFPRCPPANYPTFPTDPSQALVFWLGGAQDSTGNFIGFSADPTNPFDNVSGATNTNRIGPFFTFDKTRMYQNGTMSVKGSGATYNLYQYFPLNGKPTPTSVVAGSPCPYLYYKAVASSYTVVTASSTTFNPIWSWKDPNNNAVYVYPFVTSANTAIFVNPTSYQLLCPGLDGMYAATKPGATTYYQALPMSSPPANNPLCPQYPIGANYSTALLDDVTNFTNGQTLGGDMP